LAKSVGADGAAGLPAGEQPGRGSLIADGGVAAPGGDEVAGEGCQGFGQLDGYGPESECDRVGAASLSFRRWGTSSVERLARWKNRWGFQVLECA
jgi:hypothetical protein